MEDGRIPSLMIQEYIPGKDDSVWMFNGYFDEHSECLFGITGKKIHQTPVYTGMTALGVCLPNPAIESATKALVKAVGYKGILDIGYRYDARDSSYKLLDANPSLGATFRLFVADNGMDVARAQYLHFTGQPMPASNMREGRKWIVEDADLISCIQYFRDGALTISDWLCGYAGIRRRRLVCGRRHHAVSSHVVAVLLRPFRKILRAGKRLFRSPSEIWCTMQTQYEDVQQKVNDYFESSSEYWKDIYSSDRLLPAIYQDRHSTTLDWITAPHLPATDRGFLKSDAARG